MRTLFAFFIVMLSISIGKAQTNPVTWQHRVEKIDQQNYQLVFTAHINPGWYLYSQYLESDDGPIPTSFSFMPSTNYELIGKTEEAGNKKEGYDEMFDMNIIKYGKKVEFIQKVKSTGSTVVKGSVEFMTCDDHQCLPPTQIDFSLDVK